MVDVNGELKPFDKFLNDVQSIEKRYNSNYLRAEYNFAVASAQSASQWEQIAADGDRFDLQYRTAGDSKVRPTHAALNGVTLPPSSPFWDSFMPPNGWNCRCTAVQVRRGKYPNIDVAEALALGEEATADDKRGMLRFNPGKLGKTFPDYNPYAISRCRDCNVAKGKASLAKGDVPESDLCAACRGIRGCVDEPKYSKHPKYGERLLICDDADKIELEDNIRCASAILDSFPELKMGIRPTILEYGKKNPEYTINGLIADRKGIESHSGVANGFLKAKRQGCKMVVLDLDMHHDKFKNLPTMRLSSAINNRWLDFFGGDIEACFVVYEGKAVRIDNTYFTDEPRISKSNILAELEKLKRRP